MLEVKNINVTIRTDEEPLNVVNDISFELQKGKTLGIVGESGSGKTMLALSLLRLNRLVKSISGEINYMGKDLMKEKDISKYRGKEISLIMQNPDNSLNPTLKVGTQIEECLDDKSKAVDLIKSVGISDPEQRLNNYPHQLSGGMKQRILIAMAIAKRPKVLIADEPTSGLDVTIQAQVLDLLEDIKKKRLLSMILITHDMGVVAKTCDEVLIMYAGTAMERASIDEIFYKSAHPYTKCLLQSIQRFDKEQRMDDKSIKIGKQKGLFKIDSGCSFYQRCNNAKEICLKKKPEFREIENNHFVACHLEA